MTNKALQSQTSHKQRTNQDMCWANRLFFIMVLILASMSFLSGCGNKGKLYLPENTPAEQPSKQ